MPFKKGQSGNPAGKPKGLVAHRTAVVNGFIDKLMASTSYMVRTMARLEDGKAQQLELYLWQLAGGKPKETVDHQGGVRLVIAWQKPSS